MSNIPEKTNNKVYKNELIGIPKLSEALSLDGNGELWNDFKKDITQYELSDKSNDSDSDVDENYDSVYFSETEADTHKGHKASLHNKRIITRKNKYIAKWAEDRNQVIKLVTYQQKMINPDIVFGKLSSDTVNLKEIFGTKCKRLDIRGSSANWKNEYWTPLQIEQTTRAIKRDERDPVKNLNGKFVMSQTCNKLEEVMAKDEDSEADDIFGMQV